ncbi:MAG: hypothetical protein IJI56_03010 [Firmicutes bacterium]|nr:hypothetical protein [Bacillota bacterium]
MDKKTNLIQTFFMSVLFSVIFTAVGYFMSPADPVNVSIQFVVGLIVGMAVSLIIPVGEIGSAVASKLSAPGSPAFSFFMFNTILLIMLVFMCPIMAVIFGCVLGGAPLPAILHGAYGNFVPFYICGALAMQLLGTKISKLSAYLAHPEMRR